MRAITEPARETPISGKFDVIAVGGGLSGVSAAVAAARAGAKVALLERSGMLGGVATSGLMASMTNFFFTSDGTMVIRGLPEEIVDRLASEGGTDPNWRTGSLPQIPNDPEVLQRVLCEMLDECGVEIRLYSMAVGVVTDGPALRGVIAESVSGREAILGEVTVDATGDADVAARAGAKFDEVSPEASHSLEFRMANVDLDRAYRYFRDNPDQYPEGLDIASTFEDFERAWLEHGLFHMPHGGGSVLKLIRDAIDRGTYVRESGMAEGLDAFGMYGTAWNGTVVINTGFYVADATDVRQRSRATIEARRMVGAVADFLRGNFPGFERAFVVQSAPELGVRITRRIVGKYRLTLEEMDGGARFDDTIGMSPSQVGMSGGVGFRDYAHDIPYGIVVPEGVDRLLVASGKNVSTEPRGALRGQVWCMELGQAAGTAAALCAASGARPGDVDVRELQRMLLGGGVYLGDERRLSELGLHV